MALEMYKADWGYYPETCPCRISYNGFCELTNNWILWRTLSGAGGSKKYINFSASQLRVNLFGGSNLLTGANSTVGGLTNICDGWGTPYNYFNSPTTSYAVSNSANLGYTLGGQVNTAAYDLFSYGPDHVTYVPNAVASAWKAGLASYSPWTNQVSAADDISN